MLRLNSALWGTLLLVGACSSPDERPASTERFQAAPADVSDPVADPADPVEPSNALTVRVDTSEDAEGRLVVAAFEGENPWGWTLDVLEMDTPEFPQELVFNTLLPGVITVRAVLDRAPFDWINPGPEDLIVSATMEYEGVDTLDLMLREGPGASIEPTPAAPGTEDGLPLRVACNCDGLTHLELAVLSLDGEVVETQTLVDPELPADLTMSALEPGEYRLAWHTDDYPDWTGDRRFAAPLVNAPLMVLVAPQVPANQGRTPGNSGDGQDNGGQDNGGQDNGGQDNGGQDNGGQQERLELREQGDFPNRAEDAQQVSVDSLIYAAIGGVRDFDWFVFTLEQNSPVLIETSGTTDTRCQIVRDIDGASTQDDDSGEGNNCRLAFNDLPAGTYRLRISHYAWLGRGEYTLTIGSTLPE